MKIVNLTPHAITIRGVVQDTVIPPSGTVARIETEPAPEGDGLVLLGPVTTFIKGYRYTKVVNLPDPEPGTLYLVSLPTAQAVPGRDDVVAPGPLIRDENGNPVACDGLIRVMPGGGREDDADNHV